MSKACRTDETLDALCEGTVRITQKRDGYRFSIDAILLANFVVLKSRDRLLDIGTGSGIIPIYLTTRGFSNEMVGVEIQEELFDTALRNRALNECENINFLCGDIREEVVRLRRSPFHVIVSNPPFSVAGSGRTSPNRSRQVARGEVMLDLASLMTIASSLLFRKGRLYIIYPAKRLARVIDGALQAGLEPKKLRMIHPHRGAGANLFLAEFVKGAGPGVSVESPLAIFQDGVYTEEVESYYRAGGVSWKAYCN
jgi:tRNA1Val (adenine37-N6)-methyltransferase